MAGNNNVTRAFGRLMEHYDVLLTPTLAIRVPEANGPYSLLRDDLELDAWVDTLADACRFTMPGNETGLPGINVPAGLDSDGVPIGVQVHGNFRGEDALLQWRRRSSGRGRNGSARGRACMWPPAETGAQ